jgi:hypothetical protein
MGAKVTQLQSLSSVSWTIDLKGIEHVKEATAAALTYV